MNRRSHSILSFLPNFLALSSDLFYIRIELFSETCCCVTRERKINNGEFFRALKQNSPSNFHRFLSEVNVFLFRRHRSFLMSRGDEFFLGWTREEEEEEEVAETSRGIAAFQEPALRRYSIFTLAFARQRRAPRGNINGRSFSRRVNLSLAIIDHPRAKFATIPPPDQCPAVCHLHCPVVSLSCCLVVSLSHRRPPSSLSPPT